MFREIRTRERITEEDRRRREREEELEMINRVTGGRHYTDAEVQAAKAFADMLFETADENTRAWALEGEKVV